MDLLASEYGWSKDRILRSTYPEEFFMLQRQVRMRKTDEYLMDVAIVANPHKNPEDAKEFVEGLLEQRRFYRGEPDAPEQLDVTAFEKMRQQLSKESNLIKVK